MHLSEVIYLFKSQYLQSEDVSSEDIIEHYGVLGQKWGVRKSLDKAGHKQYAKDAQAKRIQLRKMSASQKLLKKTMASDKSASDEVKGATYKLGKAETKIFGRKEAVKSANKQLNDMLNYRQGTREGYLRAERIHKANEAIYRKMTQDMIKKYGKDSVKSITTKEISDGSQWMAKVIKTGLNITDLPILGNKYNGQYITEQVVADRSKNMDAEVKKRW